MSIRAPVAGAQRGPSPRRAGGCWSRRRAAPPQPHHDPDHRVLAPRRSRRARRGPPGASTAAPAISRTALVVRQRHVGEAQLAVAPAMLGLARRSRAATRRRPSPPAPPPDRSGSTSLALARHRPAGPCRARPRARRSAAPEPTSWLTRTIVLRWRLRPAKTSKHLRWNCGVADGEDLVEQQDVGVGAAARWRSARRTSMPDDRLFSLASRKRSRPANATASSTRRAIVARDSRARRRRARRSRARSARC